MVIRVRKLNSKGFAITTVVYGLSIMGIMLIAIIMGVISANREHNRTLAKSISEELSRYSKTETSFSSQVSGGQEYIVPEGQSGWYRIELWGAQGGGEKGGLGAYTTGIIQLYENDRLYFYIGKHKSTGQGGEETDVRIINGDYNEYNSYSTRIMVAAGGGADEDADGGTLVGYSKYFKPLGGRYSETIDSEGNRNYVLEARSDHAYISKTNGTLLGYPRTAKEDIQYAHTLPAPNKFLDSTEKANWYKTLLEPSAEFNGGDGYVSSHTVHYSDTLDKIYGGSMYGGASFISGYAGTWAWENGNFVESPGYKHIPMVYDDSQGKYVVDSTKETRMYYFYDGMMYPGVNKGEGKAKITKLLDYSEDRQELPRHNQKLDKIQTVVMCVDADAYNFGYDPPRMKLVVDGEYPAYERNHHSAGFITYDRFQLPEKNQNCQKYTIDKEVTGVDELSIFPPSDSVVDDLVNVRITVGAANDPYCSLANAECSQVLKENVNLTPKISETSTFTGIRFSAYQFDSTTALPNHGNYIIQPVLYENRVLTAATSADDDNESIKLDYMGGYKNQQWSIEKVENSGYGNNVYKIVELSRFKALSVKNDENKLGNTLIANRTYNSNAIDETQLWRITPMGDGTYTIETVIEAFDPGKPTGYLVAQTNPDKDNYQKAIVGYKSNNPVVQRWKFISTDYSSN